MKRRACITGVATLPILSGCLDDVRGSGGDDTGTDRDGPPFEIPTVDAPGSDGGTVSVPTSEQVQLVNCIRITCPTSRAMLSRVREARDRLEDAYEVGPDGSVHVVTVVDEYSGAEPSRSELADWWAEQDGDWTFGIDEDGVLFDHYEVSVTPTTIAIDGTGEVHWRDEGGTTTNNLVSGVETALESSGAAEP